ncbi:MAG: hypothetical protein CR997_13490 [Acidobacteria bacterium]|nr:MAG: hypothetical protein CR997_13490 [Acidobacteriota bacterium]
MTYGTSNSRRRFLKQILGASACLPFGMGMWSKASETDLSFDDYKALVCVFLYGGADSASILVPASSAEYSQYESIRAGLGVARDHLLGLNSTQASDYGLFNVMEPLHRLYETGDLAFVANVGSLMEPATKEQLLNNEVERPPQLFSHSDQQFQWATSIPGVQTPIGWGGRIADLFGNVNGQSDLSMNITLAGQSVFLTGEQVVQYALSSDGPEGLFFHDIAEPGSLLAETANRMLSREYGNVLQREFTRIQNKAISLERTISSALEVLPPLETSFPESELGEQLLMVTRMIQARHALGNDPIRRQIYLVAAQGWDTHDNQNDSLPGLLNDVAVSMRAFNDAMVEMGINDNVTAFTSSEFGRTLTNNGNGTDHGWGGHQMVMGGSVNGGDIFGTMPNLELDGPDDAGQGRIIPTLSVDQFNATLAKWFGVPDADMDSIFPHLSRFNERDIGFMA